MKKPTHKSKSKEYIENNNVLQSVNSKRLNRVTVMENLTRPSIKTLEL